MSEKVSWILFGVFVSLFLYFGVYKVGYHVYTDHKNLHTITQWVVSADAELAKLKKPVLGKVLPPVVEDEKK